MSAGVGGCVLLIIWTQHKHAVFTHTAHAHGLRDWGASSLKLWRLYVMVLSMVLNLEQTYGFCTALTRRLQWTGINGSVCIPTMGNWALHSDSEVNTEAVFHSARKKTTPKLTDAIDWNVAVHSESWIIRLPTKQPLSSHRILTVRLSFHIRQPAQWHEETESKP